MGYIYQFCPFQNVRPSLTEEVFQRGGKKRELNELGRNYRDEKGFTLFEMWEYEWWRLYKITSNVLQRNQDKIHCKSSLTEYQLLEKKEGKFVWLHSMRHWSNWKLETQLATVLPIFKNTLVSKNDIGELSKNYAEVEGLLSQPRKMLISRFTL